MGWAESLLGNPFDSAGKFQRITTPVLIIHGAEDDTLPDSNGSFPLRDGASGFDLRGSPGCRPQ